MPGTKIERRNLCLLLNLDFSRMKYMKNEMLVSIIETNKTNR